MSDPNHVTLCLEQIERGDRSAIDRLLPHVYADLRRLADGMLRDQRREHTLQPTALVNEAYLRLVGSQARGLEGRRHFLCVAAIAMRQLLVDYARRRATQKRGADRKRVMLDQVTPSDGKREEFDLVALDSALHKLQRVDPRQARIVEMRFLAGMTYDEIAEAVGVSARTARLDWQMARAWLRQEIERE